MKTVSTVIALAISIFSLSSFINLKENDKEQTQKSQIIWTGSKVVGGDHTGVISIKENNLEYKKGTLVGGSVTADMTSLTNTDLEGEYNQKLVGHLKSDDFFSTSKFPTSTMKIEKITPGSKKGEYNIVVKLTIKGTTTKENLTAKVAQVGKDYVLTSSVNIDRTKYGIQYGSNSFFDSLGDKAISDEFNLNVTVITPQK